MSTKGMTVREEGVANRYTVMKDGNWLMSVLVNGELTLTQQRELMQKVVKSLAAKK